MSKLEDAERARIHKAGAAATTPTGGSYIRNEDGSLSRDPNDATLAVDAPAGATASAPSAAVAPAATPLPPTQDAAKKR